METFEKVSIGVVVVGLLFVFYNIYQDMTADKFSLRKDSWACTEFRMEPYTTMVGKIIVTNYHNVCYNWKRNAQS